MDLLRPLGDNNDDKEPTYDSGSCPNCSWSGLLKDCGTESEWDEFWGRENIYPICPKCDEGLDDFWSSTAEY